MGRILSIDYGEKRCGMSATDILKLSINPLPTIETRNIEDVIMNYVLAEEVELIIWGYPTHNDGAKTQISDQITTLANKMKLRSKVPFELIDESFSSVEAKQILFQLLKKNKRKEKGAVDKMSAMIILKRYLERQPL